MENSTKYDLHDSIGFHDEKHYLKGVINISRINTVTGEKEDLETSTNILPISGMQFVLMKMFGLYLDSVHKPNTSYEDIGQDTNLAMPDLNDASMLGIGTDPASYPEMTEKIADNHFIQGFMVGNGGSGEDSITTKNTDYSYINLRNPIPFQQSVNPLSPTLADKYLGDMRGTGVHNYYIKKFDATPHIYHSWWKENQAWDYVDPVERADLGPAVSGNVTTPKSNRIETYAEAIMSINVKDFDCVGYFSTDNGRNSTPQINELGLVAFDATLGSRSIIGELYERYITKIIKIICMNANDRTPVDTTAIIAYCKDIVDSGMFTGIIQSNIRDFYENIVLVINEKTTITDDEYEAFRDILTAKDASDHYTDIGVEAYYNQNGKFIYATDEFINYLNEISTLSYDEANRIKLVTYYTFNSIPLQENWNIIINYRIYAN